MDIQFNRLRTAHVQRLFLSTMGSNSRMDVHRRYADFSSYIRGVRDSVRGGRHYVAGTK